MKHSATKSIAATAVAIVAVLAATLSVAGPAAAQLRSAVTILHSIPGLSVDLVVDGEVVIAGFNAGDTQDLSALAGQTLRNIEAREPGGGAVVVGPIDAFEVPSQGNASVVVHLDSGGDAVITTYFNEAPPLDQGRGRLVVRHVAAAPPIDLTLADETVLTGIDNAQEAAVELPAGEITDAWITAGGERIARLPNLELDAQSNLTVYVGGSVDDDSLAFYLQVVAGGQDSPVSVIMDDTPDGPDATEATVDSEVDGQVDGADDQIDAAAQTDDGTPQPTVVNTGSPIGAGRDVVLLMIALGAALLAVGALTLRRRVA